MYSNQNACTGKLLQLSSDADSKRDSTMLKTEFNKSKGQVLNLICPDCAIETRHIVIQSVDQNGRHERFGSRPGVD